MQIYGSTDMESLESKAEEKTAHNSLQPKSQISQIPCLAPSKLDGIWVESFVTVKYNSIIIISEAWQLSGSSDIAIQISRIPSDFLDIILTYLNSYHMVNIRSFCLKPAAQQVGIGKADISHEMPNRKLFIKTFKACGRNRLNIFHKLSENISMASFNTLRLRQDGRHLPDDIFKCIFLIESVWISLKISLKFVPKVRINNIPALVHIMAWRRPVDKPLSEPLMVKLLMYICHSASMRLCYLQWTGNGETALQCVSHSLIYPWGRLINW